MWRTFKDFLRRILPWRIYLLLHGIHVFLRTSHILGFEYGLVKSAFRWSSTDKFNRPIPWYTYAAIEYLNGLDFSEKRVFEYGSGNSTLYWSRRCKAVVAVESDEEWYRAISSQVPSNASVEFSDNKHDYVHTIHKLYDEFDVVVIDGKHRFECAIESVKRISSNAMIILDNSELHGKTAQHLRESNLIQVDLFGFSPIVSRTGVTSIFMTREFDFQPILEYQPQHPIGSFYGFGSQFQVVD